MADRSLDDAEPPRRPRRGPPPRLYVLSRKSPVPWLRLRRLGEADRAALLAHFGRVAAADRRFHAGLGEVDIAALCGKVDFSRLIAFGAIARNAIVAAAYGVAGLDGPEIATTEDPEYRQRDLGAMLMSQVLGAEPGSKITAPSPGDAEWALLRLVQGFASDVEETLDLAASA